MDPLLLVREVLVLVHLVGFALLLGGWTVQASTRRYQLNTVFRSGLGIMIVSGLILAVPFPAGVDLNYIKLGVKLVVALGIGGMFGLVITRSKAEKSTTAPFWTIGGPALLDAGIALIWH